MVNRDLCFKCGEKLSEKQIYQIRRYIPSAIGYCDKCFSKTKVKKHEFSKIKKEMPNQ